MKRWWGIQCGTGCRTQVCPHLRKYSVALLHLLGLLIGGAEHCGTSYKTQECPQMGKYNVCADRLPKDILPTDTLPKDVWLKEVLPTGLFADKTVCRLDFLPTRQFANGTVYRQTVYRRGSLQSWRANKFSPRELPWRNSSGTSSTSGAFLFLLTILANVSFFSRLPAADSGKFWVQFWITLQVCSSELAARC